jgi:short-subunit dehydrogenase
MATMGADEVAEVGLHAAAAGSATVAAGWQNKAMVGFSPLVPRAITRRLLGFARRNY